MLDTYDYIDFQIDFYQNNFGKFKTRLKEVNAEVNKRIGNLNALIAEYNQASPGPERIEMLFELTAYQQFILNACPDYYVNFCFKFRKNIQRELYDDIQSEFMDLNASLYKPVQARFDLEQISNDEGIGVLDILLSKPDESNYKIYFGKRKTGEVNDIKNYFSSISWEKDSRRIHSKLIHLRELLRIYIAETVPTMEEKKAIRGLVGAVNSKVKKLEANEPHLVVEKQPGKANFQKFIATMSSEKLAYLVKVLDSNDLKIMSVGLNTLYPTSDISSEAQNFRNLLQEYTIEFLGGCNSKCFKITEMQPTGQPLILKIDNHMNNPRLTEVRLGMGALLDIIPVKYLDRKITYTAGGEDKTRAIVVMDYYPKGDLRNYSAKILHWDDRRIQAIKIYKEMAETLIKIQNADAAFPDLKNHNWLIDDRGHLVIADTKSFVPVSKGILNRAYLDTLHCSYTNTTHMNSKPVIKYLEKSIDVLNVDEIHAYMLGKNLYQFVTGCKSEYLTYLEEWLESNEFDFDHELFQDEIGQSLQKLILGLVTSKPMPIRAALGDLEKLEMQKLKLDNLRLIAVWYQDPEKTRQKKLVNATVISQDLVESLGALKKLMLQYCIDRLDLVEEQEVREAQKTIISKNEHTVIELLDIREKIIEAIISSQNKPIQSRIEKLEYEIDDKIYVDLLEEAVQKVIDKKDLSGYKAIQNRLTRAEENQSLKSELMKQIRQLVVHSFGKDDRLMKEYEQALLKKVEQASGHDIETMRKEVVDVYNFPLVTDAMALIERYRRKSQSLFAVGNGAKANAIETAFAKVPVHLRNLIFADNLPETVSEEDKEAMLQVKIAIASSRYGKAVAMKDGDIDENTASPEFKILKDKYKDVGQQEDRNRNNRSLK